MFLYLVLFYVNSKISTGARYAVKGANQRALKTDHLALRARLSSLSSTGRGDLHVDGRRRHTARREIASTRLLPAGVLVMGGCCMGWMRFV